MPPILNIPPNLRRIPVIRLSVVFRQEDLLLPDLQVEAENHDDRGNQEKPIAVYQKGPQKIEIHGKKYGVS